MKSSSSPQTLNLDNPKPQTYITLNPKPMYPAIVASMFFSIPSFPANERKAQGVLSVVWHCGAGMLLWV